jgi:hypothetical protein
MFILKHQTIEEVHKVNEFGGSVRRSKVTVVSDYGVTVSQHIAASFLLRSACFRTDLFKMNCNIRSV